MNTQTQKIALITGGSRGLGRNTAESLARKGVDAVITYRSRADEAQAVVAKLRTEGRKPARPWSLQASRSSGWRRRR